MTRDAHVVRVIAICAILAWITTGCGEKGDDTSTTSSYGNCVADAGGPDAGGPDAGGPYQPYSYSPYGAVADAGGPDAGGPDAGGPYVPYNSYADAGGPDAGGPDAGGPWGGMIGYALDAGGPVQPDPFDPFAQPTAPSAQ